MNLVKLGYRKYLVVTSHGVQGSYLDLGKAKEALSKEPIQKWKTMGNGRRKKVKSGISGFIAEVDIRNTLQTDPHFIGGISQNEDNGFNKYWQDWNDISRLIEMCKKYLEKSGNVKQIVSSKVFNIK